jgi:hypothetical protein
VDLADVTAIVEAFAPDVDDIAGPDTRPAAFVIISALAVGPSIPAVQQFLAGVADPDQVEAIGARLAANGLWDGDAMVYAWLDEFWPDTGTDDTARGAIGFALDCLVGVGAVRRHPDGTYQSMNADTLPFDEPPVVERPADIDLATASTDDLRSWFRHNPPTRADVDALLLRLDRAEPFGTAESPDAQDDAARLTPVGSTTIEHAKVWLRANMSEGVDCPACGRMVKMYRRNISGHMARALLAQYRAAGIAVVDTRGIWPSSSTGGPNVSLLRFWRLIEPGVEPRTWRVTDLGVDWLAGRATVPSHALLYDNRCFGLEGDPTRFVDVLDEPFDLAALMAERPFPPRADPSPKFFEQP